MEIRPFQQSDEAAVIALWQACGLVLPQNNPAKDIARKTQKDPELFYWGYKTTKWSQVRWGLMTAIAAG